MKGTKILAAAMVGCIVAIAAGATFRNANGVVPQPSAGSDFNERWISIKSDRLPSAMQPPFMVATAQPPEVAPPVAPPPEQLPQATEDDLRQAEEEHHRHRDVCPHGRTYFTIEHHQYWRCKV
jgi:hypothetical protein